MKPDNSQTQDHRPKTSIGLESWSVTYIRVTLSRPQYRLQPDKSILRRKVVRLNFDPQAGHEQAGYRPGLVVSPASFNGKLGLALICPITNQVKGYPFEVPIPSGSKITGVVLSDQIKCLAWKSRQAKLAEKAPAVVLANVRQHLKLILEIQ